MLLNSQRSAVGSLGFADCRLLTADLNLFKMLRTLIIDDETHCRNTLKKILQMNCQQVILVGEASGVATGLLAAEELKPDLVLLDTSLKDGSGFDFLNLLHSVDFKIIFISANDQ